MGIFLDRHIPAPAMREAFVQTLMRDPVPAADAQREAADHVTQLLDQQTTKIAWARLSIAVAFALALLGLSVWTAMVNLPDISKGLMTSFQSFSGLVVGLLGGEAAASAH